MLTEASRRRIVHPQLTAFAPLSFHFSQELFCKTEERQTYPSAGLEIIIIISTKKNHTHTHTVRISLSCRYFSQVNTGRELLVLCVKCIVPALVFWRYKVWTNAHLREICWKSGTKYLTLCLQPSKKKGLVLASGCTFSVCAAEAKTGRPRGSFTNHLGEAAAPFVTSQSAAFPTLHTFSEKWSNKKKSLRSLLTAQIYSSGIRSISQSLWSLDIHWLSVG